MNDQIDILLSKLTIEDTSKLLENIEINTISDSQINSIKTLTLEKLSSSKKDKNRFYNLFTIKRIAFTFMVLFTIAILIYSLPFNNDVAAYVTFDINPSIEISIDKNKNILSYTPLNNDGNLLLSENAPLNVPLNTGVEYLTQNAINEGYINDDGSSTIALSSSSDDDSLNKDIENELTTSIYSTLNKNGLNSNVEGCTLSLSMRDEAVSLGISPGKLNLIKKLQELDPSISLDDYKNKSVREIQNKVHELNNPKSSNDNTNSSSPPISSETPNTPGNGQGNNPNQGNGGKYNENSNGNGHKGNSNGNGNGNGNLKNNKHKNNN